MFPLANTDKWTAFLLSACVPGLGQLAAGSWTWLAWLVATAIVPLGLIKIEQIHAAPAMWLPPLKLGIGVALCLLSAEHAKRLLETARPAGGSTARACACRSHSRG